MAKAIGNDRNAHIDKVKQTVFAYMEAARRRAWDECSLIDETLARLGCSVKWREPLVIDPDDPRRYPSRH